MADRGEILAPVTEPAADDPAAAGGPVVTGEAGATTERVKSGGRSADQAHARVGTTLRDKWRLDSVLGVGGMAVVYAATHRNGTRAAVKVLHAELSINELARERFLWEGQVANAVGHPGAVRVLDDDVAEDGALFLVTELLEGVTLEDRRLRLGGRLPEDEVLLAMDQVLDVLAVAHDHRVVHRDLKPDNLFLTRAGQVKVLDFGIARLRQPLSPKRLTQAGDAMGTPAFMAPEHARGLWDEVDDRSDLWAIGASMFHLLSGVVVHDGRTVNEQLLAAMTRPAVPLSCVAPQTSRPVLNLVDKALSFDKASRWPDARAMRDAIREVYTELHGAPISQALPLTIDGAPADQSIVRRKATARQPQPSAADRPVELRARSRAPKPVWLVAAAVAVALGSGTMLSAWWIERSAGGAVAVPAVSPSVVNAALPSPPPPSPPVTLQPRGASDGPPEIAATDLPFAPPPPAPAPPKAGTPRAPSSRGDCTVPYAVDPATGKKHWKLECL
jgi:serine/threonine-protein kinase